MFTLTTRKRTRATILAALTLAGSLSAFFASGVEPAMALCKYGGPHCANPNPIQPPKVGGLPIPGSGWHDPECGNFGNCQTTQAVARHPLGGTQPVATQSAGVR